MTTVTSTQATTVIAKTISGDYRIDVLLEDGNFRWNAGKPLGSPVEVTYSYMSAAPTYSAASDKNGFTPFTDSQKAATEKALADISAQFNITFKLVDDTATSYGQIRLGNNAQGATSAGYAFYPDPSLGDNAGDVYINNGDPNNLTNVVPGTNAYATIVHEIGHALGIKHPGNYNAGEPASKEPGNFLAAAEDSEARTIMSYVKAPQGQERDFFGTYDMLALQYLYGVRPYNTGANTYSYDDTAGQKLTLINDNGGVDTIDASKSTAAATIDLREGAFSSIGRLANGNAATNNVSIAFGVTIENAIGTVAGDTMTGNDASNALTGGAGSDTIDGGAGIDTAVFSGARGNFTITKTSAGYTVTDNGGTEGSDRLANVERLQFTDKKIAIDLGTNASATNTAEIIGAAFGKQYIATPAFVGIGLSLFDSGQTMAQVAQLCISADPFGQLGRGTDNAALVKTVWQNLVGSPIDATNLAAFTGMLDSKQVSQADLLVLAAQSSINQTHIDLVGLAATGIEYA